MRLLLTTAQRLRYIAGLLEGWIAPGSSVLDIGTGEGFVARWLKDAGHQVIPLDVRDRARARGIRPLLYDGEHIPFGARRFDYALLSTVLHHTPAPEALLREAARVARRVIIIEDIYTTPLGRMWTSFACSLANMQFAGHPHSTKNDAGWRETFGALGLELLEARYASMLMVVLPFRQAAYHLRLR